MTENTLKYELPLTTSTGRARVKRRKEEFGEPLKTEDKLSNEDYIEWQISYFLPFDTLWEKFKSIKKNKQKKKLLIEDYFREFKPNELIQELINFFEETEEIQRKDFKNKLKEIFEKHNQILIIKEHKDNKTYVMYELADLFERAIKEKVISKKEIEELLNFNKEKIDIERQYSVKRKPLNKKISEDFEFYEEYAPLFIKRMNDKFFTEIQIKHKQKAVGYQGMVYFCIWIKSLKDKENKPLIGRKAKSNEKVIIPLSKEDLFDIAKTFMITSKDHDWDMKTILKGIIKD
ncbi:MAG: R.Pab1 family restriction endonuclease [Nanoarchaeota archaeon]|nr:R.Pab1 family restriction endonuclease [Nanoarchaeota archaeon]